MKEIRDEFEKFVGQLETRLRANSLAGTDGERARTQANELIREYRSKLAAEEQPSRGRELLTRFREAVARL